MGMNRPSNGIPFRSDWGSLRGRKRLTPESIMKFQALLAGLFLLTATGTQADVVLKPVKRGCWTASDLGGVWIHCSDFNDFQSKYDYLEWTFKGTAGTYELQINHVAHFSG